MINLQERLFFFSFLHSPRAGADRSTGTCLPQDEAADQAERKKQLEAAQKEYEWDTTVRNDVTGPTYSQSTILDDKTDAHQRVKYFAPSDA